MLLALLVLHRAKLLASNQSVLALGVAPMRVVSRWCRCVVQRLCATDCKRPCLVRAAATLSPGTDAGRVCPKALCKDAYKWSNKVGAGRTDNKRPRLHRCRANQAYTAFPGERGLGIGIANEHLFIKTDFF